MSKICEGCGVVLQDENIKNPGYTTSLDNNLCMRCFRLKNYGEYENVTKSEDEFLELLDSINETKDLVVYVADILNVPEDLNLFRERLNNNVILVLNKRDVLPKSVNELKLVQYFKERYTFFNDIIIISSEKNYNIDYLLARIKFFQTTKNVYVIGNTNAGKSTLINKLIKNYSDSERELTISPLPSTTLSSISIVINDYLTVIDTPGYTSNNSITAYINSKELKILNAKKEIRPKTYQIKKGQSLIIDDYARIDYLDGDRNSFTFYMSNNIKVKKINTSRHDTLYNLNKKNISASYNKDLVIEGLGFIKMVEKCNFDLYLDQKINNFLRDNLI